MREQINDVYGNILWNTDVPHVYAVHNGIYKDEFGIKIEANFIWFDEAGQYGGGANTIEEAQHDIDLYVKYLEGNIRF